MSTKPDYEAAAQRLHLEMLRSDSHHSVDLGLCLCMRKARRTVDAALIAAGGEIAETRPFGGKGLIEVEEPGRYLVYGPLSETPEVPT